MLQKMNFRLLVNLTLLRLVVSISSINPCFDNIYFLGDSTSRRIANTLRLIKTDQSVVEGKALNRGGHSQFDENGIHFRWMAFYEDLRNATLIDSRSAPMFISLGAHVVRKDEWDDRKTMLKAFEHLCSLNPAQIIVKSISLENTDPHSLTMAAIFREMMEIIKRDDPKHALVELRMAFLEKKSDLSKQINPRINVLNQYLESIVAHLETSCPIEMSHPIPILGTLSNMAPHANDVSRVAIIKDLQYLIKC